jgi:hypothetical protein
MISIRSLLLKLTALFPLSYASNVVTIQRKKQKVVKKDLTRFC